MLSLLLVQRGGEQSLCWPKGTTAVELLQGMLLFVTLLCSTLQAVVMHAMQLERRQACTERPQPGPLTKRAAWASGRSEARRARAGHPGSCACGLHSSRNRVSELLLKCTLSSGA